MRRRTTSPVLLALGALAVAYLGVPVVALLVRLAGSHRRGFGQPGLAGAAVTSVETATITTVIVALTGVPLAHWLAGRPSHLRRAAATAVQLPLALPPVMGGIVLLYLLGPYTSLGRLSGQRLTGSLAGIVAAQTFVAAPFAIIAARSAFAAVDPGLDDLAATLGFGRLARTVRVALPAAGDGVRAGLVLCWLRAFGEYGATVLLAYHPYSLPVFTSVQFGSAGLPDTQAPTAVALAIAALVVVAGRARPPRRRSRPTPAPTAVPVLATPPPPAVARREAATLDLRVDATVGTYRVQLAHRAASHRLALLGPSGSGKTITLRSVAGLLGPGAATVSVGGRAVSHLPPELRRLGLVPQGHLLLPGRRVAAQLTVAPHADHGEAARWLHLLHLEELVERHPDELSGGQRQRVALAQALSTRPDAVLLDEPTSALDALVRDELRRELRRLQHDEGLSTLVVTHDPEEAAVLADEVLVIDGGRMLQAGPFADVLGAPASAQVARLLGARNIATGTAIAGEVVTGALRLPCATALADGTPVQFTARPDRIGLRTLGDSSATVIGQVPHPVAPLVQVAVDGGPVLEVADATNWPLGARVGVAIDPDDVTVWPAATP